MNIGWLASEQNVVQLECRKTSSCTIRLHGGTISSWRVNEREQIFVSQTTKYNWTSPINGGIYVVFPQFKTPKGYDNDFTKMLPWTLISGPDVVEGGDMEAEIQLKSDVYCMSRFKHPFSITTYIRLMESELFVLTEIHNPADDFFKFNFSIRAFLKVPLKHSLIEGLNGVKYLTAVSA
ncbi:uncharacterized protein isoform X2 [Rhodnius prolixus]|uniref:uncharacterized protein isoform X2 n=1 Tax=Rhodnius prolixus TaxID=13249 RepID=UPI003D18B3F3